MRIKIIKTINPSLVEGQIVETSAKESALSLIKRGLAELEAEKPANQPKPKTRKAK